jgi:carboxymethylenebutenolidase
MADPAGETVTYRAGKDTLRGVLFRPRSRSEGKGKGAAHPAVIIVHGDFGLTGWVKSQARRLAARGYVTLAVDLYRGDAPPADVMDAHILDRALPEDRVRADLKAAVDYLTGRPDVRAGAVGIIGWDSGGGNALDAAIADSRLRAAVVCYGRLVTDARVLAPLRASVLGIFAARDEGISAATIEQFRAAMRKAGKRLGGLEVYADCGHGFMNPSDGTAGASPEGTKAAKSAKAANDAWEKIDAFFAAELKPSP